MEVDPPPKSPNVELRQSVAQCPIGWGTGSPQAMIGAIGYEWNAEGRGHYSLTSVEIYTQQPDTDVSGWELQIKPLYAHTPTKTVLNASTNDLGVLRVVLLDAIKMNTTGFALMGFDVRLVTADGKFADISVTCYPIHISKQAFRDAGHIERIIPNTYGVDVGVPSLLGSEWNAYYRSSWRVSGVAAAPSLRKLKPTTLWAELKKR